jgi:McrBC 5-methylcytosine restriction system component
MTLTVIEASEYTSVRVRACLLCIQEGYASTHPHEPVADARAVASNNPDEEWATLGLHMTTDGPTAHWYVGQIWLREPDVVLRVTPKVPEASAFRMYMACLGAQEVSTHLGQTIQIGWQHQAIPLENEILRQQITPLLIAQYLHVLYDLCRWHLRVAFRKVEENLTGRLRGRPVITAQIRQNVTRGRLDRVVCQFQVLSVDTLANQILRAALEQSLKYLRRHAIEEPLLWHWASYACSSLAGVSLRRIAPLDFKGLHYGGFLRPYREPPRRLGAQHGVMARGRGSLADATGDAAAARGEKRGW